MSTNNGRHQAGTTRDGKVYQEGLASWGGHQSQWNHLHHLPWQLWHRYGLPCHGTAILATPVPCPPLADNKDSAEGRQTAILPTTPEDDANRGDGYGEKEGPPRRHPADNRRHHCDVGAGPATRTTTTGRHRTLAADRLRGTQRRLNPNTQKNLAISKLITPHYTRQFSFTLF